jgi:hypothetical protein
LIAAAIEKGRAMTATADVKKLYDSGIEQVQAVLFNLDATPDLVATAKTTLKDLTTLMLAHTLSTVEGRTALLTGLIVELRGVVDAIATKPKFAQVMTDLKGVVDKATAALRTNKDLLAGGG